jgi:hypothetical protein
MPDAEYWDIYRFELVYFDARCKCWQYFQENPQTLKDDGQEPHRRQVQQILDAVRKSFSGYAESTDFKIVPAWNDGGCVRFKSDPMLHGIASKAWSVLLDRVVERARTDGIARQHRDEILGLLTDLQFLRYSDPQWLHSGKVEKVLSAPAAIDLLSLLVTPASWGLPGCWYDTWRAIRDEHQRFPPTELSSALWREPYYLTRLIYGPPLQPKTASADLFGYNLQMEARTRDLSDEDMEQIRIPTADYFAEGRCYKPREPQERAAYILYSYFFDNVLKQLSRTANDSQNAESRTVISVAYPIVVPGWTHFLHAYVRPRLATFEDVERLCVSWQPLEARLLRGDLRLFLSEAVQRFTITLFQKDLAESLVRENRSITDDDIYRALAEHGGALFPLESITVDSGKTYSYVSSGLSYKQWQESEAQSPAAVVGAKSRGTIHPRTDSRGLSVLDRLTVIPDSIRGRNPRTATNDGRIVQLFEQQMAYARTIQGTFEHQQTMASRRRAQSNRHLQIHLEHLSWAQAQDLRRVLDNAESQTPLPGLGHNLRQLAETCIELSLDTDSDLKRMTETLQRLLAPSTTLMASEYFAIGPIKQISHPDPMYFTNSVEVAEIQLEHTFDVVSRLIQTTDYSRKMAEFHTAVKQSLREMQGGRLHYVNALSARRSKEFSFHIGWEEGRALPKILDPAIPQGVESKPPNIVGFEVHLPVQELTKGWFNLLDRSITKFGFAVTHNFSFALRTSADYAGAMSNTTKAVLYKNYLIIRYHSASPVSRATFEEQRPPDAFTPFCQDGFTHIGRFYLAAQWAGARNPAQEPISTYRYQLASNPRGDLRVVLDEISLAVIFPAAKNNTIEYLVKKVFADITPGDYMLIFEFDSWRTST